MSHAAQPSTDLCIPHAQDESPHCQEVKVVKQALKRLERKIGNLVGAIADGGRSAAVHAALKEAEARQAALDAELAVAEARPPHLMPNLAELYHEKVGALHEAFAGEDAGAVREQIRALVEEARLLPSPTDPKAPPAIETRGQLAAMLALASGSSSDAASAALAWLLTLVAGARSQLDLLVRG